MFIFGSLTLLHQRFPETDDVLSTKDDVPIAKDDSLSTKVEVLCVKELCSDSLELRWARNMDNSTNWTGWYSDSLVSCRSAINPRLSKRICTRSFTPSWYPRSQSSYFFQVLCNHNSLALSHDNYHSLLIPELINYKLSERSIPGWRDDI